MELRYPPGDSQPTVSDPTVLVRPSFSGYFTDTSTANYRCSTRSCVVAATWDPVSQYLVPAHLTTTRSTVGTPSTDRLRHAWPSCFTSRTVVGCPPLRDVLSSVDCGHATSTAGGCLPQPLQIPDRPGRSTSPRIGLILPSAPGPLALIPGRPPRPLDGPPGRRRSGTRRHPTRNAVAPVTVRAITRPPTTSQSLEQLRQGTRRGRGDGAASDPGNPPQEE